MTVSKEFVENPDRDPLPDGVFFQALLIEEGEIDPKYKIVNAEGQEVNLVTVDGKVNADVIKDDATLLAERRDLEEKLASVTRMLASKNGEVSAPVNTEVTPPPPPPVKKEKDAPPPPATPIPPPPPAPGQ